MAMTDRMNMSVWDGIAIPLNNCPKCSESAWMDTRCYVRCNDQTDCGNESPLFDTYQEAADWWNGQKS